MDVDQMRPLIAVFLLVGILIAILWILLPFAVFGTKDKLQEIIDQTIKNTQAIEKLHDSINKNVQP